jgi:predicted metalloendopeptidase
LRENDTVIIEALKKVMFNVVKLLLRDSSPKNETNIDETNEIEIKKQLDDLVSFETKIANMTTPLSKRREESQMYNNLTMGGLNEIADFLDWTSYFQDAFK